MTQTHKFNSKNKTVLALLFIAITINSCKKDDDDTTVPVSTANKEIFTDFSINVAQATYNDLSAKTTRLYNNIQQFNTSGSDADLNTCKQQWKTARAAWEQSEGFLFGPVSTENIDPRIDTWPINYTDLDSVLNSSSIFTDGFIDSLEDALRGFHPVEYLLFGSNGTKLAADFTSRQKEYMAALAKNIKNLTAEVANDWNPSTSNNYHIQFVTAGESGSIYTTQRAAFEELVSAMAGICDEVANGKMEEPFASQDPSLEESPFSKNSIIDFTNNIKSVENIYLGKYSTNGKGVEDFVKQYNLSLDGTIKQRISNAIAALGNITDPFGAAIFSQPVQITNAQNAINELKDVLENDLMTLVQQKVQ
jgi:predicted lipoprotein